MIASLAFDCTDESWYDPYCMESGGITPGGGGEPSSPFWETRDRCTRAGCGGEGVDLQQVYMTMKPHMAPDDRHAFTYDLTAVPGTATWDPNPMQIWSITTVSDTVRHTVGEIERQLVVELESGVTLDLAHTGNADITVDDGTITASELTLELPEIAPPDPMRLTLTIDPSGVDGTLSHGDTVLATWGGTFEEVDFAWQGGCAP